MTNASGNGTRRQRIGIWSELKPGARWANEGLSRVVGFLIEGAVAGEKIRFEIVAPYGNQEAIKQDLRTLKAAEGVDWIVHPTPNPNTGYSSSIGLKLAMHRTISGFAKAIASLPGIVLSILFVPLAILLFPILTLRGLLRRANSIQHWKRRLGFIKQAALRPREILAAGAAVLHRSRSKPIYLLGRALSAIFDSSVQPVDLDEVERGASRPFPEQVDAMVTYANTLDIDGWVVLFPFFTGAIGLKAPKAVIFADALPFDFPSAWVGPAFWADDGAWPKWRRSAQKLFAASETIITFSHHVARRHGVSLFNLPPEKVHRIPLAPPDLALYLPSLSEDKRSSAKSRKAAGDILRKYAAKKELSYLIDFPFETTPYFVVATQDRPTKNIGFAAQALRKMVRDDHADIKMITTANFLFGETWTSLPGLVADDQLHFDILSMPDLPRDVHAALFHCATLTVHPSFFEGIVGSLPFYESLSVGTPVVFGRGPHTEELVAMEPELARYMFDPYDLDQLVAMIRNVMADRAAVLDHQLPIAKRLSRYSWSDAADLYAAAATGRPAQGVESFSESKRHG